MAREIAGIYDTVLDICRRADIEDIQPELVAIKLAEARLAAG
jgi:hypothetical protein